MIKFWLIILLTYSYTIIQDCLVHKSKNIQLPYNLGDDIGEADEWFVICDLDTVEHEVVDPLPGVLLHQVLHVVHPCLQAWN